MLAYLWGETGAELVERALAAGAMMSTVNWSEVLAKVAHQGTDPRVVLDRFERSGALGTTLVLHDFVPDDALRAAQLRPVTAKLGLSLGDRACLALAARLAVPILTADRTWRALGRPWKITVLR